MLICLAVFALIFTIVLHIAKVFLGGTLSIFLQLVRMLTFQGEDFVVGSHAQRLNLFCGYIFMTILFSAYSGALLDVILTPPKDKYQSAKDIIIDGTLKIARTNVVQIAKQLKVSWLLFKKWK